MPTNKIIKTDDTLGIGYGPSFAGIKVDTTDLTLQYNADGTIRTCLTSANAATTWTGVNSFVGATSGAATAALVIGGGTSTTPMATSTANKNFLAWYGKSTATTGDSRLTYQKMLFSGAGVSGEALRAWGVVDNVAAAVGGTVNGAHISLSVTGASGSISGQGFAARLTFGADAQTRTLNPNCAPLMLESDLAAGNTATGLAFVRVTNTGTVTIPNLLRIPAASNGTIFAVHTTQTITHSIRFVSEAGTVYYIMCTDTATNRS